MILIERNDIMKLTKKYETLVRNYLSELYSTYMLRNDISFIKGGLVALLEYKLPKKQFKKVLNILDDNFTSNWLPYFFDKEEFITTFIDFVFLGGNWIEVYRNNDSCESFRDRPTKIVSRKEMNDIYNYPMIEPQKDGSNCRWFDNKKYNWEIVMADDCQDPKYGKQVVDLNLKIRRKITMGEFYQSSTVD